MAYNSCKISSGVTVAIPIVEPGLSDHLEVRL